MNGVRRFATWSLAVLAGLCAFFALLVAWPLAEAPSPSTPDAYRIENIRIVDVERGSLRPERGLTVVDGRIAALGADAAFEGPRIDGGGATVVPAFWDMHMHSFQLSPQLHFPLWVANGVTNLRDMMGCPGAADTLIACTADKDRWNRAVAAGTLAAPRIVEAASYYFEDRAMSPAEARRRVAAYDARGVGAIKVYNWLNGPAYRAAAAEAEARGLRLVGHLPKRVALEDALVAGQDSFEHAHLFARHCFDGAADWRRGRFDDAEPTDFLERVVAMHRPDRCADAYAAMAGAGAWFVPTHVTREEDIPVDAGSGADPRLDYLDPLSRWAYDEDRAATATRYPGRRGGDALRAYFDHGLKLTGQAHEAGVRVLVGTDTAIGGFRYHDEMAHLVRAGLSPAEVLRAATVDAATYAGMADESGTIAVGKRADLVLLRANPLGDIAATRDIVAIVQGGRYHDRDALDALLAFVKRQAGAPHIWAKLVWGFARSSVGQDL